MTDCKDKKEAASCPVSNAVEGIKKRVRGVTSMSLEWLAERFRKTEKVKEQVCNGDYKPDSSAVAKAILNEEKK